MSGGKGGGQSTKTEIPVWAQDATKRNLARAEDVQRIGYMPYYGPDVAAFNPTQQLAMQNNMDAAAAFGLASPGQNAMAGMPRATDYNGIQGYSSGGLYEQAVAEFERNKPGYAREYNKLFAKNSSSDVPPYPTEPYPNFPVMDDPSIPDGAGQQFPENVIPIINVMDNYGENMTSMPKMPDVDLSIVPPNSDLSMTSPFQIPLPLLCLSYLSFLLSYLSFLLSYLSFLLSYLSFLLSYLSFLLSYLSFLLSYLSFLLRCPKCLIKLSLPKVFLAPVLAPLSMLALSRQVVALRMAYKCLVKTTCACLEIFKHRVDQWVKMLLKNLQKPKQLLTPINHSLRCLSYLRFLRWSSNVT
jgi:hypothetical protein